jgi:hypothetical protein
MQKLIEKKFELWCLKNQELVGWKNASFLEPIYFYVLKAFLKKNNFLKFFFLASN